MPTAQTLILALKSHNQRAKQRINTIACPGLDTGISRLPYGEAARMMALAYDHFLYPPKYINCL
jgi:O-acetyl-ADP-ribose deacetylase (regulator of RNase III)